MVPVWTNVYIVFSVVANLNQVAIVHHTDVLKILNGINNNVWKS